MSTAVIYSDTDTHGKKDATHAFIPEARAFGDWHRVPAANRFGITCPRVSKKERRRQFYEAIETVGATEKLDVLAVFGHGWPSGIQFGVGLKQIPELVEVLKPVAATDLKIVLYACLTAENSIRDRITNPKRLGPATDGGFADRLRDALGVAGISEGWIDGHKSAGHSTFNPLLVRFYGSPLPEVGGTWLVQPGSQFWTPWREALRGSLRLRFPLMTEFEILTELAGREPY